jgi:hypothetical protein
LPLNTAFIAAIVHVDAVLSNVNSAFLVFCMKLSVSLLNLT